MILPGILAAGVTLLGWVLAQILFLRWVDHRIHFRARFFLYLLSFLIFLVWQRPTPPLNILNGALLHLLFFCNFMAFYYAVAQPVTLRILVEAKKSPQGILEKNRLYQNYSLRFMIQKRLSALVQSGYLAKEGERYFLTAKGKWFARIFLKGSELYGVERV
ncbi:MAG: hypothetical protein HY609_05860 [Deltaproteobacteria bacterium]|nr:hypothetical protein [Deltaproteobacteria bacterium]